MEKIKNSKLFKDYSWNNAKQFSKSEYVSQVKEISDDLMKEYSTFISPLLFKSKEEWLNGEYKYLQIFYNHEEQHISTKDQILHEYLRNNFDTVMERYPDIPKNAIPTHFILDPAFYNRYIEENFENFIKNPFEKIYLSVKNELNAENTFSQEYLIQYFRDIDSNMLPISEILNNPTNIENFQPYMNNLGWTLKYILTGISKYMANEFSFSAKSSPNAYIQSYINTFSVPQKQSQTNYETRQTQIRKALKSIHIIESAGLQEIVTTSLLSVQEGTQHSRDIEQIFGKPISSITLRDLFFDSPTLHSQITINGISQTVYDYLQLNLPYNSKDQPRWIQIAHRTSQTPDPDLVEIFGNTPKELLPFCSFIFNEGSLYRQSRNQLRLEILQNVMNRVDSIINSLGFDVQTKDKAALLSMLSKRSKFTHNSQANHDQFIPASIAAMINILNGAEIFTVNKAWENGKLISYKLSSRFSLGDNFILPSERQLTAIESSIQFIISTLFDGNTAMFNTFLQHQGENSFYNLEEFRNKPVIVNGITIYPNQNFQIPQYTPVVQFLESVGLSISLDPRTIYNYKIKFPDGTIHTIEGRSLIERKYTAILSKFDNLYRLYGDEKFRSYSENPLLRIDYSYTYNGKQISTYSVMDRAMIFQDLNSQGKPIGWLIEVLGYPIYNQYGQLYGPGKNAACKQNIVDGYAPVYLIMDKISTENYYLGKLDSELSVQDQIDAIGLIAPALTMRDLAILRTIKNQNPRNSITYVIQQMHTNPINTEGFSSQTIIELQALFGIVNGQITPTFQQWWINFNNSFETWIKDIL